MIARHSDSGSGDDASVIDWTALNELVDGSAELLGELFSIADRDMPVQLSQLEQALRSGDLTMARHVAHTLKGMATSLSARRVFRTADRIERLIVDKQVVGIETRIDGLRDSVAEALRELAKDRRIDVAA